MLDAKERATRADGRDDKKKRIKWTTESDLENISSEVISWHIPYQKLICVFLKYWMPTIWLLLN